MDRQPQRSPTLRLHDLLLALAGRLDDTALSHARRLAALARLDDAVDLVTGTLIAGNIALRQDEQLDLATLLTTCGSEPALAEQVVSDDDAVGNAEPHRFSAADAPDKGVADAIGPVVAVLPDVRTVHAVWRNTVAGSVPGPMPQRLVLVGVGPDGAPIATAHRMESALRAAGISAAVEVTSPATTPSEYHRAALAAAVSAIGTVDPDQRSVDDHDQQPTAPGWHSVVAGTTLATDIGDADGDPPVPAEASTGARPAGEPAATGSRSDAANSSGRHEASELRHGPASWASATPGHDATALAGRAHASELTEPAERPSTAPELPTSTDEPSTATPQGQWAPAREHDNAPGAEPTTATSATGAVEDTWTATDHRADTEDPAAPAGRGPDDEPPATAGSPWLTANSFAGEAEQDPGAVEQPVRPVGTDASERAVPLDAADAEPPQAAPERPGGPSDGESPVGTGEPEPAQTTYAEAQGQPTGDSAGPPWTPVTSGPRAGRPWPVEDPATPAPEPATDDQRDWPGASEPDPVNTTTSGADGDQTGAGSTGATVFAFDAADAVRSRRNDVASDGGPAESADLAPGELFRAADSAATDIPSTSDTSYSMDDPGTPPATGGPALSADDAGSDETPEESTDQLSPEDVERLRTAIEQPEEPATIQRTAVAFPSEGLDNPRLSDRDRELLRELHAELAKREREQATQVRLNGREKPGS